MNTQQIEKEFSNIVGELRELRKALFKGLSIENIKVIIPNTFEERNLKDWDKWAETNLYHGNNQLVAVSARNIIQNINNKIETTFKEVENQTYIKIFSLLENYKIQLLDNIEKLDKFKEQSELQQNLLYKKYESLTNQFIKEIKENPNIIEERLKLLHENMQASLEIEYLQQNIEEKPKEIIEDIKRNIVDDEKDEETNDEEIKQTKEDY